MEPVQQRFGYGAQAQSAALIEGLRYKMPKRLQLHGRRPRHHRPHRLIVGSTPAPSMPIFSSPKWW